MGLAGNEACRWTANGVSLCADCQRICGRLFAWWLGWQEQPKWLDVGCINSAAELQDLAGYAGMLAGLAGIVIQIVAGMRPSVHVQRHERSNQQRP